MKYKVGDIIPFEQTQEATDYVNSVEGNYYLEDYAPDENGNMQLIVRQLTFSEPTFDEVRTTALSHIDSVTSSNILAGFDYKINNEILHFSYNHEDQLNFSDTFNGIAMKKLMGVEDLPETIDWNGWRNPTESSKGELVVLTLTPEDFLTLYTKGALIHKQTHLEIGKQRKKLINDAITIEEINSLLKEWNI